MTERGKRSIFQDGCTLPANEGTATAVVKPGQLVEFLGDSDVAPATADGVRVAPMVADYDFLRAGTVDDEYGVGDRVVARQVESGKRALVRVAAAQDITDLKTGLASNGDGAFRIADPAATPPDIAIVYADEVINTGAAEALVRVRGA